MGDPRKLRKKYEVPRILWEKERIDEESALVKEYGLKNIKEIWIAKEELRKIRRQARKMLGLGEKGQKEFEVLANRITKMGYGSSKAIEDVLGLNTKAVLDRRLQTLVLKKGLARSMKQARQLITHGFIAIDGKKVSTPGRLVTIDQEEKISYYKPIELYTGEDKEKKMKKAFEEIDSPAKEEAGEKKEEKAEGAGAA
jgi:small subunit ribosomal protein S4